MLKLRLWSHLLVRTCTLSLLALPAVAATSSGTSVELNRSGRLLFAVSAASNQVSAFAVEGDRLNLLNTIDSGGQRPVSVAVHGNLVYALNAGGTPNITGFTIDPLTNKLVPLAGD